MPRIAPRSLSLAVALAFSLAAQPAAPSGSVRIEFISQGSHAQGKVFPAPGPGLKPTLLMVPGWPGNPDDVANLGAGLAASGINMVMFNPRGMHASEGSFSFSNVLADIDAALAWLGREDVRTRFNIDTAKIALGGHSMGGGLVMVYAATHPGAPRQIIGVAPGDVGEAVRDLLNNPATQAQMRNLLTTPGAFPVRISDIDGTVAQIKADGNRYWLKDAAPKLTDRSILLIGGWDDPTVTMEAILPFYRALKKSGVADVTFLGYHDGHQFASVKQRLASDIANWLRR